MSIKESIENNSDFREKVLSTISKEGSTHLLKACESGLKPGQNRWEKFDLSKRQYYSRLRSLKNLGLIKKTGGEYVQTELGKQVYEIILNMEKLAENSDTIEFARSIRDRKEVPEEEKEKAREFLNKKPFLSDVKLKRTKLLNVINDYKELRNKLVRMVKNAEEEIYLATNYADHRIIKTLTEIDDSMNYKGIITHNALSQAGEFLRALWNSEDLESFTRISEGSTRVCRSLPYSFILKDGKMIGVEIQNPMIPDKFFLGIILEGEEIYKTFKELFEDLYEGIEENSASEIIKENIF